MSFYFKMSRVLLRTFPNKMFLAFLGISLFFATLYLASVLSKMPLKYSRKPTRHISPLAKDFIKVVISTRRSEIIGALAAAKSVITNTKRPVYFCFVTSAKTAPELHSWIEGSSLWRLTYEIKIFDPDSMGINRTLAELENGDESWIQYSKFFIKELFPQVSGITIYLSPDVIVQGDIGELQNITIGKNDFAALSSDCDAVSKALSSSKQYYFHYLKMNNPYIKDQNVDAKQCALNLDVMVLNMTLWESENVGKQLTHWYHLNEKENIFHVNSVHPPFLIVFNKRISLLDSSWHVRHLGTTRGTRYSRSFLKKANLLQWDGHFKPWKHKSAISDIWFNYMVSKPKKRW